MSNLAQIEQSSSIEMENSINSIIKDMLKLLLMILEIILLSN